MNNEQIKLAGVVGGVLVIGMLFYGLVYIPRQEVRIKQDESDRQETKEISAKLDYDSCILTAYDTYKSDWELNCEKQGLEVDCALPRYISEDLVNDMDTEKTACLKNYEVMRK